ncbi:zinc finger protein CONSTANS-LIKE 4-like [Rosa chinensis]|uniref:zinc finger protein CONSTANS-LIKE 4-like n=1 Tax=Rosa chinensis TaxID=74649 RepID=UPI000D087F9B|nr:zinc finger protein CONSTANS-LIKE 4-like [Rosa chinensis]
MDGGGAGDGNMVVGKVLDSGVLPLEVSSSSFDVGVVLDGNSLSDISYPFIRNVSHNGVESSVTTASATVTQLCRVDCEVMRYREKRKKHKFQRSIRYASRKAYAETRSRIKGWFAKAPRPKWR